MTGSPRYKWWVVVMLWGVCVFNYADRQAIFSVFKKLEIEFGFTKFQMGLIGSAFAWVYAASGPVAGFIGDRFRRKDLILGGFFFWSIITMMTGWCQKFWQFFGVRAAEGFGEAFYFPASMSMVSDYHGPRTRSRAMSFHQSGVYIGTIAGGALGGFFAERYGWRFGFYFFGILGMVLAACLLLALREPVRGQSESALPNQVPPHALSASQILKMFFRLRTAPLLMMAFVGANFVATTFLTWMPTFLADKFGLTLTLAGLAGTFFVQAASAIGAPCGGWLADKLAARHPGGRMLVQAGGLICGAGFAVLTGTTRDPKWLMLWMACFGFFKGIYDSNIFASLYDVIHPGARGSAAGLMNAVGWTGGALAPAVIGWLLTHGGKANEVANMSLAIACGGIFYIVAAGFLLIAGLVYARREVVRDWSAER